MKRKQINTIFVILAIAGGVVINFYRFYPLQGGKTPKFEIFDVRTFNDLEPTTIVHYQVRNVGRSEAHEVLTSVSPIEGNESQPAFFATFSIGEVASVNSRISPGDYPQLRVGVICREFRKAKYYNVEPNLKPDPPQKPDFIVYNLTLHSSTEDNITSNRATFWIMNIGGATATDIAVSLEGGTGTSIDSIPPGESMFLSLDPGSIDWEAVIVYISCEEGVEQNYFLIDYG
jgi:hypothetical protein